MNTYACNTLYHKQLYFNIYYIIFASSSSIFTVQKLYRPSQYFLSPLGVQTFAGSSRKSQTCPAPLSACWTLRCHYRNWKAAKDLQSRIQQQLSKVIYNATFCRGSCYCFTCFLRFWKNDSTLGRVYILNKATEWLKNVMGTALVDARANRTTKMEQPYQLSNHDLYMSFIASHHQSLHLENSCFFNSITLYKGPRSRNPW